MITYYSKQYTEVNVILREDFQEVYKFYIRPYTNVVLHPVEFAFLHLSGNVMYDHFQLDKFDGDVLLIGNHDTHRRDKYQYRFCMPSEMHFIQKFYIAYDIPYSVRIDCFEYERDHGLEEQKFNELVPADGRPYALLHDTDDTSILEESGLLAKYDRDHIIQLGRKSDIIFDCVKVLEGAAEMHLIDSVWAAFCYMTDCKYKLFHDKEITVYCKRHHQVMFTTPIVLSHWIVLP